MKKQTSVGIIIAVIILTAATTFNITYVAIWNQFSNRLANFSEREDDYRKLDEIRAYLDAYYIDEYDMEAVMEGAAQGMLDSLPDGWSYYMSADEYAESQDTAQEEHAGIGVNAYFDEGEGLLRVVDVYGDSPAERSGICFYDLILAIDGVSIAELGQENVEEALRGEKGSVVTLTVQHSDGSVETVEMAREQTTEQALEYGMPEDTVGYIRIPTFNERVDVQFESTVELLAEQGAKSLVIDLRFNPGGRQDVMCAMLDLLLPEGVIMQWEDKQGQSEIVHSGASCIDMPVAVLVNGYSFSAAEFFAAALQEYGAAVIVGEQTSGKCYAQRIYALSDGSAIAISTAAYTTPQGHNLQDTGVVPDVNVTLEEDKLYDFMALEYGEDSQLQAALEALRG